MLLLQKVELALVDVQPEVQRGGHPQRQAHIKEGGREGGRESS